MSYLVMASAKVLIKITTPQTDEVTQTPENILREQYLNR